MSTLREKLNLVEKLIPAKAPKHYTAIGTALDALGEERGVKRLPAETDADYRERIDAATKAFAGLEAAKMTSFTKAVREKTSPTMKIPVTLKMNVDDLLKCMREGGLGRMKLRPDNGAETVEVEFVLQLEGALAGAKVRRMLVDVLTRDIPDVYTGGWEVCPAVDRWQTPPAVGTSEWLGWVVGNADRIEVLTGVLLKDAKPADVDAWVAACLDENRTVILKETRMVVGVDPATNPRSPAAKGAGDLVMCNVHENVARWAPEFHAKVQAPGAYGPVSAGSVEHVRWCYYLLAMKHNVKTMGSTPPSDTFNYRAWSFVEGMTQVLLKERKMLTKKQETWLGELHMAMGKWISALSIGVTLEATVPEPEKMITSEPFSFVGTGTTL